MGGGEVVPVEEVRLWVASVARRLALLHVAYARAIVEELGPERGLRVIARAIREYGRAIGERTREEVVKLGLEPTPENFDRAPTYRVPPYGMYDRVEVVEGERRVRVYGCVLARVWRSILQPLLALLIPGKLEGWRACCPLPQSQSY